MLFLLISNAFNAIRYIVVVHIKIFSDSTTEEMSLLYDPFILPQHDRHDIVR